MDNVQLQLQLREAVPDQELARARLHLLLQAVAPGIIQHQRERAARAALAPAADKDDSDEAAAAAAAVVLPPLRTAQVDVAYLYGPPSVGKTGAAIVFALLLQSPTFTISAEALANPEQALNQLAPEVAACIHRVDVNTDRQKTAEPARIIAELFEKLSDGYEADVAASDDEVPVSFQPRCVTIIFEEFAMASKPFVQPLMSLFESGCIRIGSKRTVCPVPLVILCLGNNPDESVLSNISPSDASGPLQQDFADDLDVEVRELLDGTALNSRVVKYIVPFFPYRSEQFPAIVNRILERLRPELAGIVGVRADAFIFSESLRMYVRSYLKRAREQNKDADVRVVRNNTSLQLRAAVSRALEQGAQLNAWAHIYCSARKPRSPDDACGFNKVINMREHNRDAEELVATLRFTWAKLREFLNRSRSANAIVFLPDPSVLLAIHEQCRAVHAQTSNHFEADEAITAMLSGLRIQAQAKQLKKARGATNQRRGCIYRLMVHHHADPPGALKFEARPVDVQFVNISQTAEFSTECALLAPFLPPRTATVASLQRVQKVVATLWTQLIVLQPELRVHESLLSRFQQGEQSWPSQSELEAQSSPWQFDGPLQGDERDFFLRLGGLVPPPAGGHEANGAALRLEDDDNASLPSETPEAVRPTTRNRVPTVMLQRPGQEHAEACIPFTTKALACYFGWPDEAQAQKNYEQLRNDRRDAKHSAFELLFHKKDNVEQQRTRIQCSRDLGVIATTKFVVLAGLEAHIAQHRPIMRNAAGN